jgi:hypothetical protein
MSRSFKKTPIMGIATSSCQKKFKQQEHQKERASIRSKGFEEEMSTKKFGNEWDSPRDGKMWFGHCAHTWPVDYPKWMRK